jgi:hypothetical protein
MIKKYFFLISYHHTILDGWSIPILNNFVYETYLNLLNNREIKMIQQDTEFNNVQKYLQKNTNYEYWNSKVNEIEEYIDLKPFYKKYNYPESYDAFNVMDWAAENGHLEVVKFLKSIQKY